VEKTAGWKGAAEQISIIGISFQQFRGTTIIIIHTVSVNKLKIIWKACGCALGRSVGTGFNHLCMR